MATVLMLAVAWWFLSRRKRPLLLSVQAVKQLAARKSVQVRRELLSKIPVCEEVCHFESCLEVFSNFELRKV